jgi:hypothetical protein
VVVREITPRPGLPAVLTGRKSFTAAQSADSARLTFVQLVDVGALR